MLVITRRINESIVIDGKIEITVTAITKEGVRIGIDAPREMAVHRREVFESIAEANRLAASGLRRAKRVGPKKDSGQGGMGDGVKTPEA